jgi:UV DNA damage repair endonuclease
VAPADFFLIITKKEGIREKEFDIKLNKIYNENVLNLINSLKYI